MLPTLCLCGDLGAAGQAGTNRISKRSSNGGVPAVLGLLPALGVEVHMATSALPSPVPEAGRTTVLGVPEWAGLNMAL